MEKENEMNKSIIEYLNNNISEIKNFELLDDYYLIIHMKDESRIVLEPEYGAIYLNHKLD